MKKTLVIGTINLFLTCLTLTVMLVCPQIIGESLAYTPGAGIVGSPHDFSAKLGAEFANGGNNRSCLLCHIPTGKANGGGSLGSKDFPLWDRGSSSNTFISYTNGDNKKRQSTADLLAVQPGRLSKFCLGCHDGVHASNNYGKAAIDSRIIARILDTSPSKVVGGGGDLSNHHPIGFDYELVRSAKKSIAPDSHRIGIHAISDLLDNGKVECTTCHSVHNKGNTGEKLLWVSDRGSALCLSCHLLGSVASLK